ncbi:MAG: hypothetical protein JXA82_04700 [Sedimentisphaerales bacterium]|nr:hypothetical protein [Sedimentisphaerales bacterium]
MKFQISRKRFSGIISAWIVLTVALLCTGAKAELIHAGGNVTLIAGSQYYPVSQASDGNPAATWVTDAPCGGSADYFNCASAPIPILLIDLGSDVVMDAIAFWNYASTNANNVTEFSLRFATDADGPDNIGTSIGYNPVFTTDVPGNETQQDFALETIIVARYVEFTATDNMYGGALPGGDRAGFGDIQFNVVNPDKAWNPYPGHEAKDIGRNITLQWNAMVDPNTSEPVLSLLEHVLYFSNGDPADANVAELARIPAGDPIAAQAEYGPLSLEFGKTYYWRVDEITDSNTITGDLWSFQTVPAEPLITQMPQDLLVFEGETASFEVSAINPYSSDSDGLMYQWYKVNPGGDLPMGEDSPVYSIASVNKEEHEGQYYCVVTIVDPDVNTTSTSITVTLVTKQLIGHWPFDGNLNDEVGGNDGVFTGVGDPSFETGIVGEGQAVVFPAGGSPVTVPTAAHIYAAWTLSWWENSDPDAGGVGTWETMIGCGAGPDGWEIFEFGRLDGRRYAFGFNIGGSYQYTPDDDRYPRDHWHYHVVSFDPTTNTASWYIDGLKYTDNTGVNFTVFDEDFYIGNVRGGSQPYTGWIDDLKLYNYPLDPFEIAEAYTAEIDTILCVSPIAGDVTGPEGIPDCTVNMLDFVLFASQWLDHGYLPDRP